MIELKLLLLGYFVILIFLCLGFHFLMKFLRDKNWAFSLLAFILYSIISWYLFSYYFIDFGCGDKISFEKDEMPCQLLNSFVFAGLIFQTYFYYIGIYFGDIVLFKKKK